MRKESKGTMTARAALLAVPCSSCGATVGEPCRDRVNGNPKRQWTTWHSDRFGAMEKARGA